jgi:nickel-dependent lactate racemase
MKWQLWKGGHDLILSIGQVVPHEVMGMANYNKNLFVGTGGSEAINFSHFVGAVYGMERMMGRANNPLRRILNYASTHFTAHLPIVYIQTVIGRDPDTGALVTRGVFIGDDEECFMKAAELSLEVNFQLLDAPLDKVVVFLDPDEFKSTWLGNKSVYRTRMAIADDGELIVLAPGVHKFGEDARIDELIRKYGYRTTPVGALPCSVGTHSRFPLSLTVLATTGSAGSPRGQSGPHEESECGRPSYPRIFRGTFQDHLLSWGPLQGRG